MWVFTVTGVHAHWGRLTGVSALYGWHMSAYALFRYHFRGSAIFDAVSELELELDEVLDELPVNPIKARALERTTMHSSPLPATLFSPLLPPASTPSDLMGLTRWFLFASEVS